MIRAIIWKEWHEHRSKYIGYWVTLHAPLLLLAVVLGVSTAARTPFRDLTDALTLKYLPLSLMEAALVVTVFLILTGYLAVATFSPEIEDHSLFFIYEQPVSRKRYLWIKLLNGACHVVLASACAVLLFPAASYGMMLLSGKVTVAGSSGNFALVMATAARAAVWGSLISLATFTASAVVSALVPKWWLAALCSVTLTVAFIVYGLDYFRFFPDMESDSMSISGNLSTGSSQWVTISRAFKPEELKAMALWWPKPLLITLVLTVAFCVAITLLYDRKELKG